MFHYHAIYKFITYFAAYFTIVPIITGIIKKVYLSKLLIPIFILLCFYIVIESVLIFYSQRHLNNLFIFRFLVPAEITLLSIFYYNVLHQSTLKYFVIGGYVVFWIAAAIDYNYNSMLAYNDVESAISGILLVVFSFFTFYDMMKNINNQPLLAIPLFWINCSVLIFFGLTFFLDLFYNWIITMYGKTHPAITLINPIANLFYYTFISIGFWKLRKT